MRKKLRKKLALNVETLRNLSPERLGKVAGGITAPLNTCSCEGSCISDCGSCAPCTRFPCPISDEGSCGC